MFVSLFVCVDNWPVVGRSRNCFRFPSVLFALSNYTTVKASFQGGSGVHMCSIVNTNSLIHLISCMLGVESKGHCGENIIFIVVKKN